MKSKDFSTQSLKREIARNSFWSLIALSAGKFGGLIFTIILTRYLMPEGYGIYSIALSIAMILYTFSDFGINKALVRYISFALNNERKKVSAYYSYLFKIKFILTLFFSIVLLISAYPLSLFVFNNVMLFVPLIIASAYIFVLSFEGFYTNLFYAAERVKYVSVKESIGQFIRIVLLILLIYFVSSYYQVAGVFLVLIISSLILLAFNIYYIKKSMPVVFEKSKEKIDKKRVKKFVKYSVIASISAILFAYVDSIILGLFLPPEYVGYYRAAFALIFGISGILAFPNIVLLPIFTKLEEERIENSFKKTFKYISIFTIPSVFGVLILGDYFVKLFYGPLYLPSVLSLYLLSPVIFLNVAIGLFSSLFSAEERPDVFAKLILITSVINLALNFLFIGIALFVLENPILATGGVALATSISWLFYFAKAIGFSKKELNVEISAGVLVKPLIISIIMGIIVYITRINMGEDSILSISILVLEGVIIYFALMLLSKGINKGDLNLILNLLRKRNN